MTRLCLCELLLVVLAGACASVDPVTPQPAQSQKVYEKNYVVGREQAVSVGDALVKVRDYILFRTDLDVLVPRSAFRLETGFPNTGSQTFTPDRRYPIVGVTELDGKSFNVVNYVNGSLVQGLLVDNTGRPSNTVAMRNAWGAWQTTYIGNQATFTPANPIFDRLTDTKVDTNAGYENFELLYNGTDGKSLFVTYREYTSDNLARPAYFQNLTYDNSAGTIRYKKFRIRVVKATNEALSYVVLEDGR